MNPVVASRSGRGIGPRLRLVAWAFVACLALTASGKRGEPVVISFHLETVQAEWPKFAHAIKMGDPAQQYYFKLAPSLTDGDIAWYYPFIAEDGVTYGTAFKLNRKGAQVLRDLTSDPKNQGKLLAGNVQPLDDRSGPVRCYLQIDRRIDDGVLVVWQGLTDQHLQWLGGRFPHARDVTGTGAGAGAGTSGEPPGR
jgi:hypothetical protein